VTPTDKQIAINDSHTAAANALASQEWASLEAFADAVATLSRLLVADRFVQIEGAAAVGQAAPANPTPQPSGNWGGQASATPQSNGTPERYVPIPGDNPTEKQLNYISLLLTDHGQKIGPVKGSLYLPDGQPDMGTIGTWKRKTVTELIGELKAIAGV